MKEERNIVEEIRRNLEGRNFTVEGYEEVDGKLKECWARISTKREFFDEEFAVGLADDNSYKFVFEEEGGWLYLKLLSSRYFGVDYKFGIEELADVGDIDFGEDKEGYWLEIKDSLLGITIRIDRIKFRTE